jgi:acetate kinase
MYDSTHKSFWVNAATKRVLVKVHEVFKIWKNQEQKDHHKPNNQGQTMEHNRTCVTLQETLNEIKLIAKEIEISQIDHRICTHGDNNALSINTLTKTKKQIV